MILMKHLIGLMQIVIDLLGLLLRDVQWMCGGSSKRSFEIGSVSGSIWLSGGVGEWSMSIAFLWHGDNKIIKVCFGFNYFIFFLNT